MDVNSDSKEIFRFHSNFLSNVRKLREKKYKKLLYFQRLLLLFLDDLRNLSRLPHQFAMHEEEAR